MKLENKKELVARTLKVGKGRIAFNVNRLDEVKEIMTKQDVKDLKERGAIIVKEKKGKLTKKKRKTRRRIGSIRKKVNKRKEEYMILTRKLRAYVAKLKKQGKLTKEQARELRKEIRSKTFRSLNNMKEKIKMWREE